MTDTVIESTTQKYLDIHDITDDVLLLKDGSASLVITVNAMNFGLLAEPEQDAIMYAYAGLLNSLNYPIQIVIRSQTKDVTSYLNLLKEEEDKSADQTKKNWIARYRGFVSELIKERNVLDKKFYVVVSASSLEMGLLPPSSVLPGQNKVDLSSIERSVILEKAKEILEPRRDHLLGQLGRIGLYGHQLTTQEIIQLFYLSYNPEAAEGQQITDTQSYTTPLVQASVQGGFMDNQTTTPTMATPAVEPTAPVMPATSPMPSATPTPVAPSVSPSMMTTDSTTPSMPTAEPQTPPAMPAATPMPMGSPIPSIQSPGVTTSTPAMSPSTPMPSMTSPASPTTPDPMTTPPAPDAAIQSEIDSTLQQIGSMTPTTTPEVTPPSPVAPPLTPPTVGATSADTAAEPAAMPPLPEI